MRWFDSSQRTQKERMCSIENWTISNNLGALEKHGGFDFELIRSLLGQRLIDRWELWQPTIQELGGRSAYPMFDQLVSKVRAAA